MLAYGEVFIAAPNNANGIGLSQHHWHEHQQDNNAQALRAHLQQFITPWQAMAFRYDTMDGAQVTKVASCGQSRISIMENIN